MLGSQSLRLAQWAVAERRVPLRGVAELHDVVEQV